MIIKMSEKCSEELRKKLDTEWTVVLLRDGRLGVVMDDEKGEGLKIFGCNNARTALNLNGLVRVERYDENLYFKPGDDDDINRNYDIMAMINLYYINSSALKKILFGVKDPFEIAWDWKREEVKEVTMEDIEKTFGCKVKIVKEKENE